MSVNKVAILPLANQSMRPFSVPRRGLLPEAIAPVLATAAYVGRVSDE